MSSRGRSWCYTLNNYTDSEVDILKSIKCMYHVFGKEMSATQTPHIQGFIHWRNARSFSSVKSMLCGRVHIEIRRGTPTEASAYCKKQDLDFFESGTLPQTHYQKGQSEKDRWSKILNLAKEGNFVNLMEEYPDAYIRYHRTLHNIAKQFCVRPPDLKVDPHTVNIWYWGDPGTGKSRRARAESVSYFVKNLNKWWDCYQNEDDVILDDFSVDTARYLSTHLKLWSDRYAFVGEVKGTARWIRPKRIIVTSNYSIELLWMDDNVLQDAISRRFTIVHMDDVWIPPVISD